MSTTSKYSEASVDEALAILDSALEICDSLSDKALFGIIEKAAEKLRPQTAEGVALEQLVQQHPIDLPWMQPVVVVATDTPAPKCSPLSCDGCPNCQ